MPSRPAAIATTLQPDAPLVQDADYMFDAGDRQWIDTRQRAAEQHLADSLLNGIQATWFTLDSSSVAVTTGDVVCSAAQSTATVTLATAEALAGGGRALGIVLAGAAPGTKVRVALNGLLPSTITGLGNTAGFARVSSTGRAQYVAAYSVGDSALGTVDGAGGLAMLAGAAPGGGGTASFNPDPDTLALRGTSGELEAVWVTGAGGDNAVLKASTTATIEIGDIPAVTFVGTSDGVRCEIEDTQVVLVPTVLAGTPSTYTIDCDAGGLQRATLGGNVTFNAPTHGQDGGIYILEIVRGSGGSETITWNAAFHFDGWSSVPTLGAAAKLTLVFVGESGGVWRCVAASMGATGPSSAMHLDRFAASLSVLATAGDTACSTGLAASPNGAVLVFLDDAQVVLSGNTTGLWYLSGDGGTTARALGAAQAGDLLYGGSALVYPAIFAGQTFTFFYS